MKQCIAVIVAVCLMVSSCSAESIKMVVPPIQATPPKIVVSTIKIEPVALMVRPQVSPVDANCLAKAIYYEARGESVTGQAGVGYVIINRTKDTNFPNTVCGVVKQLTIVNHKKFCQFSWYCTGGDAKLNATIRNTTYETAYTTAVAVLSGLIDNGIGNAVSFNIRHIKRDWPNRMKLTATIGNHNFYERKHSDG